MKKVYVVSVQWYENEKWHNTTLHAFSNKRAAQEYVDEKRAAAALNPTTERDNYFIDTLPCWSYNFLKPE